MQNDVANLKWPRVSKRLQNGPESGPPGGRISIVSGCFYALQSNLFSCVGFALSPYVLAGELDHAPTTATVLMYKITIDTVRNDFESVVVDAENFLKISQQHGMGYHLAMSRLYLSLGRTALGGAQRMDDFRKSLADYRDQGNRVGVPGFLGALARLEAHAQNYERALGLIDEGLAMSQESGDRLYDSKLHRLRGGILLKRDLANLAQAEEAFKTALAVAKQQGARTLELLASFALAKLYQATRRLVEAHAVLKPALEGFSPTPEMPVIAKAQTLLAALA